MSAAIGPTVAVPLIARVPDQPPDAVQLVTPTPVHVSDDVVLEGTDLGFAVSVTETAVCCTVTVAVRATLPPLPVHVSV